MKNTNILDTQPSLYNYKPASFFFFFKLGVEEGEMGRGLQYGDRTLTNKMEVRIAN